MKAGFEGDACLSGGYLRVMCVMRVSSLPPAAPSHIAGPRGCPVASRDGLVRVGGPPGRGRGRGRMSRTALQEEGRSKSEPGECEQGGTDGQGCGYGKGGEAKRVVSIATSL